LCLNRGFVKFIIIEKNNQHIHRFSSNFNFLLIH
jgi:hypothetical protein